MIVFWRIRYLDRDDKQFKDRDLFLDTERLDAATRAEVELVVETKSRRTEREILKYRCLFEEDNSDVATQKWLVAGKSVNSAFLTNYFEDETGKELTTHEMGPVLTGDPNSILIPSGARQHDIDFMMADPKPIPVAEVNLSAEECRLLGYFVRDFIEFQKSAFLEDGPGTISGGGDGDISLTTAVSGEEIRSFVTIFRCLYMANEPANFLKAAKVYCAAHGDHPYAKWVEGVACDYDLELNQVVDILPFTQVAKITFTRKRLIDVFLYTQYAHQPDERRQRQFGECLNEVLGKKVFLTSMFLTELWKSSLLICNAGRVITGWFRRYCEHHQVSTDVLASIASAIPGIGTKEKEAARKERVFKEKAENLAIELWKMSGRPEGGTMQFFPAAQEQLRKAMR